MGKRQNSSIASPCDRPDVARRVAGTIARAGAMGLLTPPVAFERLDRASLAPLLRRVAAAGIAAEAIAAYEAGGDPGPLLDRIDDALEGSPVPEREWTAVEGVLGRALLARLAGASPSSIVRYGSGARATPDVVAARLHCLALVIGDLAGTYNDIGVRRWFDRPRELLDGRRPAELLRSGWSPEDAGPRRVRALARALIAGGAT